VTPEETLARGSRTFWLASRLLPADRRRDAAVVYAFCRQVDDLADERGDARALDRLDQALVTRDEALVGPLLEVAARRGLELRWARELIEGCRQDLGRVRIQTDEELVRYAYLVAGTVGLMCCAVLGAKMPEAAPFAVDLGIAMQLTNICRDVAEDALRDRVYLPADRLRRHGLQPDRLQPPAPVAPVVLELLDLADRRYERGREGLRWLPPPVRPAIAVAAELYRAIGGVLRDRDGDPWAGRAVVPPLTQGVKAVRALAGLLEPSRASTRGAGAA
jgi:phytoene synthase